MHTIYGSSISGNCWKPAFMLKQPFGGSGLFQDGSIRADVSSKHHQAAIRADATRNGFLYAGAPATPAPAAAAAPPAPAPAK